MILVTGGTGLIGAHLLLFLTRKGLSPRAIYRHEKSLQKTRHLFQNYSAEPDKLFDQIQWVEADITDIFSLKKSLKDVRQIYHAAAMVSFKPKDKAQLHLTNVEGTNNLLHLAMDYPIEKFMHVSSIAALGSYEQPVAEQTHWNWKEKHSDYAVSKYLSEMEVWRAGQEGLPIVIINPSVVLGAHFKSGAMSNFIHQIQKNRHYYPPGSNGFVDVWDVVKAMTDLIKSDIVNESFIVSAYNKSYRDILQTTAKLLNKPQPRKALPKSLAYGLYAAGFLQRIVNPDANYLTANMLDTLYKQTTYSSQKLQDKLHFNFIPFESAMTNLIAQYQKSPY